MTITAIAADAAGIASGAPAGAGSACYAKPGPRICLTALDRLGAGPAAALFIDDKPGSVAAAEALGMTGHVHAGSVRTIARIAGFARASPRPP